MATDEKCLPFFVEGEVVKGFGRGSKELGIPTANFPEPVVRSLPESLTCGVYYGWASVASGPVFPMVMSVGWNPYYHNTMKTMETHVLHDFKEDFYGSILKVIMLGYIRPMQDYSSLESLIEAINNDIDICKKKLTEPAMEDFKRNNFFLSRAAPAALSYDDVAVLGWGRARGVADERALCGNGARGMERCQKGRTS